MAVIINKPKDNETVGNTQAPQQTSAPAYTGMGGVSSPNNNSPQQNQQQSNAPKFSNIQQFLGANKNGANEVGNRVGGGVNRDINNKENQAQQSVQDIQAVRQGVEKNIINPGQQFQQNMSSQNFDPNAIVNNQDQFKQFYGIRTGQAQNQAQQDLQAKQQAAQQSQNTLNQTAQQRLGQLGTEQGRSGLLGEFVGKGVQNYNQGLGLLDQALMQRDPNHVVDTLKSGIQTKQNTEFADLAKQRQAQEQQAQQSLQQAQQLGTGLQTKANDLESGDINELQGRIAGVNSDRAAQQASATSGFNSLHSGQNASSLGYDWRTGRTDRNLPAIRDYNNFINTLGINPGQATFNAFQNVDNVNQLAKFGRQANTVQDVANQQDVDKYNALAKLAFGDINDQGQAYVQDPAKLKLTKASDLEAAVSALPGEGNQTAGQQAIKSATDNFWNNIAKQNVSGNGGMYTPDFGEIATAGQAQVNLGDFLRGKGTLTSNANTTNYGNAGNKSASAQEQFNIAGRDTNPTLSRQDIISQIADMQKNLLNVPPAYQQANPAVTARTIENGIANPTLIMNPETGNGISDAAVRIGQIGAGSTTPGQIAGGLTAVGNSGMPIAAPAAQYVSNLTGLGGGSSRDTSGTGTYLNSTLQQTLNNPIYGGSGLQQQLLDLLSKQGYFNRT